MILCGIDLETTGIEHEGTELTEIGWAIFDTNHWEKPLIMESHLIRIDGDVPKEIVELTGITKELLTLSGEPLSFVYGMLCGQLKRYGVQQMVAHNAAFDRGHLAYQAKKHDFPVIELPWIDTKKDIIFPKHIRNTNLVALAAEHGFLNPFPHAALFDVFTMMKILSKYDIFETIKYRDEKTFFVAATVDYANRALASKRGYKWQECEGKVFDKTWVKAVKERHLEQERTEAPFTQKSLGEWS